MIESANGVHRETDRLQFVIRQIKALTEQLDRAQETIARIPKEVDGAVVSLQRKEEYLAESGRTGETLQIRGGDLIEYDIIDNQHTQTRKPLRIEIRAGKFLRELTGNGGRFRILGKSDRTEDVRIINFNHVEDVTIKLTVLRSDTPHRVSKKKK